MMEQNKALEDHPTRKAYRTRQQELSAERDVLSTRRTRLRAAIYGSLILLFVLYDQAAHHNESSWPILIPIAVLVALTAVYLGLQPSLHRLDRLDHLYEGNLARVDGTRTQSGLTGEEFRTPNHLYERDLNILGPDSLFGLLATTRTGVGQRGLAGYLLDPATHEQTLARQQAVQELTPQITLREEIALLGASRFQQVEATFFDAWLDDPPPAFHPAVRWTLVLTALSLVGMLIAGLLHIATWGTLLPNLAAVAAIQGAVSMAVRRRVMPLLEDTRIAGQTQTFADGLALTQTRTFASPLLQAIQRMSREPADAVAALKSIQSQFVIVEQRKKEYFFVISLLLAAGTHAAISIAQWKRTHAQEMKGWLTAWAEFEALNAFATYAFEHPEDVSPQLLTGAPSFPVSPERVGSTKPESATAVFEAKDLGHPLIPSPTCIRNDIALNPQTRFYLISGSNMAGKSTLLRAIGINAVLAYAGAPVRAATMRLSPLALGASLALTDSLAESKSKFRAEVDRLHAILEVSRDRPTLFLVDELFSGTNSSDRRTAAEAVLHTLLKNGAIGALSTHDLALTDLATDQVKGINVHMASSDPSDPLAFDYRLKPGINQTSNALAIIRMMGIEA